MRIILASLLLLAVNAAHFVPGLEDYQPWTPPISMVIALYLLIQGFLAMKSSSKKTAKSDAASPTEAAPPEPKGRDREIDAHVVHFLGLLQEKGRLVDFVMDDISAYNNEQVGAAARVVHQGCAQVIREHLSLSAVHSGQEGAQVTLERGYDPTAYRAVGKLSGEPPFNGTLLHHGWKTTKIDLPRLAEKPAAAGDLIVTPAEVEIKAS